MNRRLISVFFFALVIAGVASLLLYKLLTAQIRSAPRRSASIKVIVATHDFEVGSLIKEGDLQQVVYSGPAPSGALNTVEQITGRGVVATIYKGEPILEKRLAPKGAGAGLAATIPIGMRAAALRVNDVVSLAGFVLPGMRVDVLVSGGQGDTITRTILQNIEVLSAGQHVERRVDNKPEDVQVVNLLVNPSQAEVLSLASNESKVQLVLRNPLDTGETTTQGASLAKIFGYPTQARAVAPPAIPRAMPKTEQAVKVEPQGPAIEVFNGSKRTEQTIPNDGGSN